MLLASQEIQINEVVSSNSVYLDEDGDSPDWIEIYNYGNSSLSLENWRLSDDENLLDKWFFPNISIEPNNYLLVWASSKDRSEVTYSRTIVNKGDFFKYLIPSSEPSSQWTNNSFDDVSWLDGVSGFGYADGDDNTVLETGTKSIYARIKFNLTDIDNVKSLLLDIDYDDGFVAYLNGKEIARANINGVPPLFDSGTLTDHEAQIYSGGKPDRFLIDNHENILVEGENILAIQLHNISESSSDLTLIPFLSAIFSSSETQGVNPPSILELSNSNNLHTNFKISSKSETLFLTDSNNNIVDQLLVEGLHSNVSIGRSIHNNNLVYYTETTPGFPNPNSESTGVLSENIIFSHQGGKVDNSSLNLLLTGNDNGETIRYTTDATVPEENSLVYTSSISISENTVIRARMFKENYISSITNSKTFLFDTNHELDVITLVTDPYNLFDETYGIYVFGDSYDQNVPYFGANFWEDWERPVHFSFYDKENGSLGTAFNAGIKIYGGWSRGQNEQRSMSIFARGEYGTSEIEYPLFKTLEYDNFQALVLRNSGQDWLKSSIKDISLTSLMEGSGLDYQSYNSSATYINGEYWGMYNLREKINEHMLASKHNIDADDVILLEGDGQVIEGSNESYKELINYISSTDLTDNNNFEYVNDQIDLNNYALYQATQIFFNNTDWPGNNIKFWTHPKGKWRWILYDSDFSFGPFWDVANYNQNTLDFALDTNGPNWPNPPWSTLLFRNLIKNINFRNRFINRYADELNTRFLPVNVKNHLETVYQSVVQELPSHYSRWNGNIDDVVTFVNAMKTFSENRPQIVKQHIKERFSLPSIHSINIINNSVSEGFVKVNDNLNITTASWEGDYFKTVPIYLKAIPKSGFEFTHWSGDIYSEENEVEINLESNRTITPNFRAVAGLTSIVINEINYKSSDDIDPGDWVELYNPNNEVIDVSHWLLKDDNDTSIFTLPEGTSIGANSFLILVKKSTDFKTIFPDVTNVIGDFDFGLGSKSDAVRLFNAEKELEDEVYYNTETTWSDCAKGNGPTLELINPTLDNNLPESWDCTNTYGSPGEVNDQSLNIVNIELNKIKLYPNSVKDILYIKGIKSEFIIEIYTVSGKRMLTTKMLKQINVSSLKKGIYFVNLIEQNRITKFKLLKE